MLTGLPIQDDDENHPRKSCSLDFQYSTTTTISLDDDIFFGSWHRCRINGYESLIVTWYSGNAQHVYLVRRSFLCMNSWPKVMSKQSLMMIGDPMTYGFRLWKCNLLLCGEQYQVQYWVADVRFHISLFACIHFGNVEKWCGTLLLLDWLMVSSCLGSTRLVSKLVLCIALVF